MTDIELRELALKMADGRVYGTWDVPQDLWRMVFMPLAFATEEQVQQWKDQNLAYAYAILGEDKTSDRAINGYPVFFSCRMLTQSDAVKLQAYLAEVRQQREEFLAKNEEVKEILAQKPKVGTIKPKKGRRGAK